MMDSGKGGFLRMIKQKAILYSYVFLVAVYLVLTFWLPPSAHTLNMYHLTSLELRLLSVTIVLPLIVIWYMAFYGFANLKSYSDLIKDSKEGRQVAKITTGLAVLVYGLPIPTILSSILRKIAEHYPHTLTATTIVGNYVSLLFPLAAFVIISGGARGLSELVKARPAYRAIHALALTFVIIGVGYCYFVMTQGVVPVHGDIARTTVYHLPAWLALLTLVVPYLYMWFVGLLAAYDMHLYNNKVAGLIYKRLWTRLSASIAAIIIVSIIIQYITSLSVHLAELPLHTVLTLIYALLVLLAVSYGLLADGAKQLKRIEEL